MIVKNARRPPRRWHPGARASHPRGSCWMCSIEGSATPPPPRAVVHRQDSNRSRVHEEGAFHVSVAAAEGVPPAPNRPGPCGRGILDPATRPGRRSSSQVRAGTAPQPGRLVARSDLMGCHQWGAGCKGLEPGLGTVGRVARGAGQLGDLLLILGRSPEAATFSRRLFCRGHRGSRTPPR